VTVFSRNSRPADERRPDVLFAGNLSVHKIDVPMLETIAAAVRGRGRLLLAGPLAAGGGSFDAELARLTSAGATYLGTLTHDELAVVAGRCSVGLIPYAINDYTRGVSPLKCYEYLSSGLAVMSTPLPSVTDIADSSPDIRVVDAASAVETLDELLHVPVDESIRRRVRSAESHGWQERGRELRALLRLELLRR
jgi:teichuronic acid biosynthesis glycosyltransferase TuaH